MLAAAVGGSVVGVVLSWLVSVLLLFVVVVVSAVVCVAVGCR